MKRILWTKSKEKHGSTGYSARSRRFQVLMSAHTTTFWPRTITFRDNNWQCCQCGHIVNSSCELDTFSTIVTAKSDSYIGIIFMWPRHVLFHWKVVANPRPFFDTSLLFGAEEKGRAAFRPMHMQRNGKICPFEIVSHPDANIMQTIKCPFFFMHNDCPIPCEFKRSWLQNVNRETRFRCKQS